METQKAWIWIIGCARKLSCAKITSRNAAPRWVGRLPHLKQSGLVDRHVSSFARKSYGRRPAHAGIAAGDEGFAAGQPARPTIADFAMIGPRLHLPCRPGPRLGLADKGRPRRATARSRSRVGGLRVHVTPDHHTSSLVRRRRLLLGRSRLWRRRPRSGATDLPHHLSGGRISAPALKHQSMARASHAAESRLGAETPMEFRATVGTPSRPHRLRRGATPGHGWRAC